MKKLLSGVIILGMGSLLWADVTYTKDQNGNIIEVRSFKDDTEVSARGKELTEEMVRLDRQIFDAQNAITTLQAAKAELQARIDSLVNAKK